MQGQNEIFSLRKPNDCASALTLSRELFEHAVHDMNSLMHGVKISFAILVGGEGVGKQRRKLEQGHVGVLVLVPGRFIK